jgi:hypothetical protein
MRISRETGNGRLSLILFLASLLICSTIGATIAFAQWQGANNIPDTATANPSDNSNTATITQANVTSGTATYTFTNSYGNPIVNNNGNVPYLVGDTVSLKSVKLGATSETALSVNALVTAVTSTSVTVSGSWTISSGGTVAASGTITPVNADQTTFLPGITYSGDVNCLKCHSMPVVPGLQNPADVPSTGLTTCLNAGATEYSICGPLDSNGYLLTGHKNILRKVLPTQAGTGAPLASSGNDGSTYPTSDSVGDLFNWTNGTYSPLGGTANSLLYVLGWSASTAPPTVYWLKGTGPTYTTGSNSENGGNYQCARCHTTGYRFDGVGPEPTYTTGTPAAPVYNLVTDTMLKRVPADYSSGATSSWRLTGIQCERCHAPSGNTKCATSGPGPGTTTIPGPYTIAGQTVTVANDSCYTWKDGNGNYHYSIPYQPVNVAATALCIECHRQERSADGTASKPGPIHTIQPTQLPGQNLSGWPAIPGVNSLGAVSDSGKCSDGSSKAYSACIAANLHWNFTPSMSNGANGAQTFLNSPHARFTGTLQQNAQNSPDLSVQLNGTFNSYFTDWGEGVGGTAQANGNNGGCTGCHNPHYSTIETSTAATAPPIPMNKQCQDCHTNEGASGDHSIKVVKHPTGAGTPLPNGGLSSTDSSPCVMCHMAAMSGTPLYHYFRINQDPTYFTFGPASKWYAGSDTPGYGQPNTYVAEGKATYPAVGLDLDIACGQCHVGGDGNTNTYGIVPPANTTAPPLNRTALATYAQNIHAAFMMSAPSSATGTLGQPLAINITLQNGYNNTATQNPVTMSVSGLPANATTTWSTNPVTIPASGTTTSTLTITVPSTTAQLGPQRHFRPFLALFLPIFGMAVASVVLGGSKKKLAIWVVLGLVLLISLAGVGCGSNGTPPASASAQSYSVMVSATSGSTTVNSTIPVTMN